MPPFACRTWTALSLLTLSGCAVLGKPDPEIVGEREVVPPPKAQESRADIRNPGPDLANFSNSAYTLPQGRAYIEFAPFTYYGTAAATPAQYNTEYLLRYGLLDKLELRVFGNGVTWIGGAQPTWGFSPIAIDAKVNLWLENRDYFLPAAGIEAYVQTEWLGSAAFNSGTQPSIAANFDQTLPFEIEFEYNVGTTRMLKPSGQQQWELTFEWSLQRDIIQDTLAAFVHGYFNNMSLPRAPHGHRDPTQPDHMPQNAVGLGLLWTLNDRVAMWVQNAVGTTRWTPALLSTVGVDLAF